LHPEEERLGTEIVEADRQYLEKIQKRLQKRMGSGAFKVHLTAFLGVNALLFVTWLLTPGWHPWFLYPAGAWGIGLAHHLTARTNLKRSWEAMSRLPAMAKPAVKKLRELLRNRGAFRQHATAVISVSGFLGMINAITMPFGFQWWLIPASAMGIGLMIHRTAAVHRRGILKRELAELEQGIDPEALISSGAVPEGTSDQASLLAEGIRESISAAPDQFPLGGAELLAELDLYLEGYRELGAKASRLQAILTENSIDALQAERDGLRRSLDASANPALDGEYRRNIESLERQIASLEEIAARLEMLELRRSSVISSLRQIRLDITRAATLRAGEDLPALNQLKVRAEELSRYLEDFDAGYREISGKSGV
jgi:hypothetical protein